MHASRIEHFTETSVVAAKIINCKAAGQEVTQALVDQAVAAARGTAPMAGLDLAKEVTVGKPYDWTQTEWELGEGYGDLAEAKYHVVAFDYGVKKNILRMLAERGCKVMMSTTLTTRTLRCGKCCRNISTAASVSMVGISPAQAITTSGSLP